MESQTRGHCWWKHISGARMHRESPPDSTFYQGDAGYTSSSAELVSTCVRNAGAFSRICLARVVNSAF